MSAQSSELPGRAIAFREGIAGRDIINNIFIRSTPDFKVLYCHIILEPGWTDSYIRAKAAHLFFSVF